MAAPPASLVPLATAVLVMAAAPVHADGAMMLGDRALHREGAASRGYCEDGSSSAECERVKVKALSGYSYGRGHATGGFTLTRDAELAPSGVAELEAHTLSAALPGGALELASAVVVLGAADTSRVRVTLVDAASLFFCDDARSGERALPLVGMLSRACEPSAVLGIDLGLFAMQWDLARPRVVSQWLRLGPSFELLGNGHSYAQLLRSIQVGVPFDLRTVDHGGSDAPRTSLGVGLRIAALLRTPHWEARLTARHRTALVGGSLSEHALESQLLALRNFFASDAIVLQVGLALRASLSARPADAWTAWSSSDRQSVAFAGIHLGWSHEPPDI